MTTFPSKAYTTDFEYSFDSNGLPRPICMVAKEAVSGVLTRTWLWDGPPAKCPIDFGGALYVVYNAPAEMACHLALGWELPDCVLDLYAEYCAEKAGMMPQRKGLLYALSNYGISGIAAGEKSDMQELCIRGGPFDETQKLDILDYCQSDVDATTELLKKMWPTIELRDALWRGEYGKAVAKIERVGIPLDIGRFDELREVWPEMRHSLIEKIDEHYGVYENGSFREAKFGEWVEKNGIFWPSLKSGRMDLKEETFSDMAKRYPQVRPLHELRKTLAELRLSDLPVGADGRNRFAVMPFRSKTGRNQPKGKEFAFAGAKWFRNLIKPPPGHSIAYIDWSGQEFGIAAALSGDANMMEAYDSGDPHLAFAKFADAVPSTATAESHPEARKQYKIVNLGILMGMGVRGLSRGLDGKEATANRLLSQHKEIFSTYWGWSEDNVNHYLMGNTLYGQMGWPLHYSPGTKTTTVRNFKLQANGAEMMRLAAIAATSKGHSICCPVHDAFLLLAKSSKIVHEAVSVEECMAEASEVILDGFRLRTDTEIFHYPDHYKDVDGEQMWQLINGLLRERRKRAA